MDASTSSQSYLRFIDVVFCMLTRRPHIFYIEVAFFFFIFWFYYHCMYNSKGNAHSMLPIILLAEYMIQGVK